MRLLLIILSLLTLLRPAIHAQEKPIKRVLTSGTGYTEGNNLKVSFLEYVPAPNPNGQKHPLIIFLHGQGERGIPGDTTTSNGLVKIYNQRIPSMIRYNDLPYFTIPGTTDTATYAVLAPQCSSSFGTWPIMYTAEMLKYAQTHLSDKVDLNRVYLVGLSQGGGGVMGVMRNAALAKKIAAAVSMCPGYWASGDVLSIVAKNGVPLWVFHAVNDGSASIVNSENYLTSLNNQNPVATIQYIQFSGVTPGSTGHAIWDIILDLNYGSYALTNGSYWNENETGRMWEFLLIYKNNNQRIPIVWLYPKPVETPLYFNPLKIAA